MCPSSYAFSLAVPNAASFCAGGQGRVGILLLLRCMLFYPSASARNTCHGYFGEGFVPGLFVAWLPAGTTC
ncbi:hypothetical protein SODALDRAFT_328746 [Sodiomyces alkalinus F11]|uniref:Secreted protein n=1 Tax=Sodiomyces alkalinus (strain CBS 110278 / VKM F-3762 / F11) TaxID=1314773 RepID=A0A3N2PLX9_SODAK|nr:hypothetical protein SODALDRAFT_328746 [Sodiomyces alkalinus F11]ROT35404.1 hypothetical protein SODALDRAFT_328746 [Sodiomyces alkalinus F11]